MTSPSSVDRLKLVKIYFPYLLTILRSGCYNSRDSFCRPTKLSEPEAQVQIKFHISARPDHKMPVITMHGMLRQEDCRKFEASLGDVVTVRTVRDTV